MAKALNKFKIVVLGDSSVGKTSILNKFTYSSFDEYYAPTLGIDFMSKTVYLDDRTIRLQLWDTAGQERFRSLVPSYIRDSAAAVIVFDVTNRASFDAVDHWAAEVRNERGADVVVFLVGNKTDLVDKRVVVADDIEAKGRALSLHVAETSAATGEGVNELFHKICDKLPCAEPAVEVEASESQTEVYVSDQSAAEEDEGGCC